MRIVLIGATGLVGARILDEAVDRGHRVTAIVRDASKVPTVEGVTAIGIDVATELGSGLLAGADAVVSAFNPGWADPELYRRTAEGLAAIERAVVESGVGRYLVVGGAGSLLLPGGGQLVDGPEFPEAFKPGAQAQRDYLARLRDAAPADLDWVYLSPAIEFGDPSVAGRTGRYRLGGDEPVLDAEGRSRISAEDLAVAVLDELEAQRHHRERFTVGY